MDRPTLRAATVMAMAIAASACGQEAATPDTSADVQQPRTAALATAGNETAPTTLWNNGEASPLDIQVAHPNGVVLQLTSLQSRATETVVGVRVINGRTREVQLNRFNNNRHGYIVVDSGERIYLSPPPSNAQLAIQANQTLEGELVFLGRLPRAQSAVLVLNENGSTDSESTAQPGFRIDLPLQEMTQ